MAELERELRELGRELDFPPTPDLAGAVRRRLTDVPAPRRWPKRRTLVVAFAVLAVAVAGILAVPQARTAVLEWFGLRGVTVKRVETLPPARARGLDLGRLVSLERAQRIVPYRIVLPDTGGDVERVYLNVSIPGTQVALLLDDHGKRVWFAVFRGAHVAEKLAGPDTTVERVRVGGAPGLWIAGRPHTFLYRNATGEVVADEFRLAGNVLLWERGGLTLRLEGDVTKERALEIAGSVR